MCRSLTELFASWHFPNCVSYDTSLNYSVYFISFKMEILLIDCYNAKACLLNVDSTCQSCTIWDIIFLIIIPFFTCPHEPYLSPWKDIFFNGDSKFNGFLFAPLLFFLLDFLTLPFIFLCSLRRILRKLLTEDSYFYTYCTVISICLTCIKEFSFCSRSVIYRHPVHTQ